MNEKTSLFSVRMALCVFFFLGMGIPCSVADEGKKVIKHDFDKDMTPYVDYGFQSIPKEWYTTLKEDGVDRAIYDLRSKLKHDPDFDGPNPEAWVLYARLLLVRNEFDQATRAANRVVDSFAEQSDITADLNAVVAYSYMFGVPKFDTAMEYTEKVADICGGKECRLYRRLISVLLKTEKLGALSR